MEKMMMSLESILENVHKCGYFEKSWKTNKEVTALLKKFEIELCKVIN